MEWSLQRKQSSVMASSSKLAFILALMVLTILATNVAGSRRPPEDINSEDENSIVIQKVTNNELLKGRLQSRRKNKLLDGLKEAMIARIYGHATNCLADGTYGQCLRNQDCCSGLCAWLDDGSHCVSGCLADGTRGCTFNHECCSGYCEFLWGESNLCHQYCKPNGYRGCMFNTDCCSGYCEWFLDEQSLCH